MTGMHAKGRRVTGAHLIALVALAFVVGCIGASFPRINEDLVEGMRIRGEPAGWHMRGDTPGVKPEYLDVYMDGKVRREGERSACLLALDAFNKDWATLMQSFSAEPYRGKRVRFSGEVRVNHVSGWTGLWMGTDSRDKQDTMLDDMTNRRIRGTVDWTRHEIVLDVPIDAVVISIGVHLHGMGQVWLDDCAFAVVDAAVPLTEAQPAPRPREVVIPRLLPEEPQNLDFELSYIE